MDKMITKNVGILLLIKENDNVILQKCNPKYIICRRELKNSFFCFLLFQHNFLIKPYQFKFVLYVHSTGLNTVHQKNQCQPRCMIHSISFITRGDLPECISKLVSACCLIALPNGNTADLLLLIFNNLMLNIANLKLTKILS